jgi:hypothetical protein
MKDPPPPDSDDDAIAYLDDDNPGLDPERLRGRRERVLTILALVPILATVVFTSFWLRDAPRPTTAQLTEISRRAVRRWFAPSLSIEFGGSEDLTVRPMGEYRYQVSGMVRATNSTGQSQLYTFECSIAPDTGGRWDSVGLNIRVGY